MSYWTVHGYFLGFVFIAFLAALPRAAMFFALAVPVGFATWLTEPFGVVGQSHVPVIFIVGWIAWFLLPRFLIALLATVLYFHTNPILCIGAWIIAFYAIYEKNKVATERTQQRHDERKETGQAPGWQDTAQDWWEVLRVSPTDSWQTIQDAYRRMAKDTHSDTAKDGGDDEKFRRATDAYNEAKKKRKK